MRKYRPALAMILLVVYANILGGCFRKFYEVTIPQSSAPLMNQIQNSESYFILHQGYSAWHLNAIALNDEQTELSGELVELTANHQNYITALQDQPNRYEPSKEAPTVEVHLYISEYAEGQKNRIIVPLSAIHKVEIYDVDQKATNAATAGSFVGLGLLVVSIGAAIAGMLSLGSWY